MFGRVSPLAALSLMLFSPESGGASDGGAGTGAGGGAGSPQHQPPASDADKARADARASALKELGFDSEDAYKAHLDEKKRAEEARLSDGEKREKALKDALDARGKIEQDLEAARTRERELKQQLAMRDKLDKRGVPHGERRIVEVLLEDARQEAKREGKAFDEDAFFAKLSAERPYLFARANTSPRVPAASPFGGVAGQPAEVDALAMSDEQYLAWRNKQRFGQALSA